VVQARITNIICFLFSSDTYRELQQLILNQIDLLNRIRNEYEKDVRFGPYCRLLVKMIPSVHKSKEFQAFEKELFARPKMDDCYSVSEKLLQNYKSNQRLFNTTDNG